MVKFSSYITLIMLIIYIFKSMSAPFHIWATYFCCVLFLLALFLNVCFFFKCWIFCVTIIVTLNAICVQRVLTLLHKATEVQISVL